MDNFEILSPGAKIKSIRKKLGLKQYEITGGEITRNLISIIENDKAALTKTVARVVAANINRACEEKDIDFHVTYHYLMESKKDQALKVVDKYLEKVSVDNLKHIEEFEKFMATYDTGDKKATAYEKLGDVYFYKNDFYKAYTYYIKANEFISQNELNDNLVSLLLKTVKCICKFERYEQALEYVNSINADDHNLKIETSFKIYMEKINILMILEKFEIALEEIEFVEEKYLENDEQIPNELLKYKARCLKEVKQYSDSLEIQYKLLEQCEENSFEKIIISTDIIKIYIMLRDNRNLRKKINECGEILTAPEKIYKEGFSPEIFYTVASACKFIGESELSKVYYKHSLNSAKRNKDINITLKALNNLFDFYAITKDIEEIDSLKNELIEIISMRPEVKGDDLVFKILSFYNDVDDKDALKGMISFILE